MRSFQSFATRSAKAYPQLDVEFIQVLQDQIGDLSDSAGTH